MQSSCKMVVYINQVLNLLRKSYAEFWETDMCYSHIVLSLTLRWFARGFQELWCLPQYMLAIDMWLNPDFRLKLCSFITLLNLAVPFETTFSSTRGRRDLAVFTMWIVSVLPAVKISQTRVGCMFFFINAELKMVSMVCSVTARMAVLMCSVCSFNMACWSC